MKKIMIIGGLSSSLIRFRGELIKSWLKMGYVVVAAAPGNEAEAALKAMGVSYQEIPLKRTGLNPLNDLFLLLKLIGLLRREKPDYLFLYTIKAVVYGSLAAYFKPRCRVFPMITGLGFIFTGDSMSRKALRVIGVWLYRLALRRASRVFFQNPDDALEMTGLKTVKAEKIVFVNGSGVDLDYFRELPLDYNPPVFLLIARLLVEKGIREYIEAARLVKAKHPQALFKMVGWQLEGGSAVIPPAQVARWQEEGVVHIDGETGDVRPYLKEASVYVLPSYREGTPRTVLEAMATGRPIITTDTPGCRETVVEGVNGFLVQVKDSEALARAMEKFIGEPELMKRMGKESRRMAEEKFDVQLVNRVINEAMGLG